MKISYGRPTGITWALSATAAFITVPQTLTNGRPADVTRFTWITGAQTTASVTVLTGTLGVTLNASCAAFLLPNLATAVPAGTKITISGTLSGGAVVLAGNALTLRTVTLPNGAKACWWVFPAASIDTIIITIYNDTNSSGSSATWAVASQAVDLGEIWIGKSADFDISSDAEDDLLGGLLQRKSHNNQAWPLAVQPYRSLNVNLAPMTEAIAIGPNPAQDDFQTVRAAITVANATVLIPSYTTRGKTGEISQQRLTRTAVLGNPDSPTRVKASNDLFYTSPITFSESPP